MKDEEMKEGEMIWRKKKGREGKGEAGVGKPRENPGFRGNRVKAAGRKQPRDVYGKEVFQWRRRREDMAIAFSQRREN